MNTFKFDLRTWPLTITHNNAQAGRTYTIRAESAPQGGLGGIVVDLTLGENEAVALGKEIIESFGGLEWFSMI